MLNKESAVISIRYAPDKPKKCENCYFWEAKEEKIGCRLGKENCYYILPPVRMKKPSPCDGYPYARPHPCIGYCMNKLLEVNDR